MPGAQLLLLVEDEAAILNLLEDALIEAGYEVILAGDGRKALRELEADADRFRGIITDIRLGTGPSGWDIGHRARELSPHIQIVYLSGDSAHEWPSKGVPNSLMVSKPFAVAQVVTAISGLLVQEDTRRGGQPT
jgi:DNA-binding response OmpR family regulator